MAAFWWAITLLWKRNPKGKRLILDAEFFIFYGRINTQHINIYRHTHKHTHIPIDLKAPCTSAVFFQNNQNFCKYPNPWLLQCRDSLSHSSWIFAADGGLAQCCKRLPGKHGVVSSIPGTKNKRIFISMKRFKYSMTHFGHTSHQHSEDSPYEDGASLRTPLPTGVIPYFLCCFCCHHCYFNDPHKASAQGKQNLAEHSSIKESRLTFYFYS